MADCCERAFNDVGCIALDRCRHVGGGQAIPSIEKATSICRCSELRLRRIKPNTSADELNIILMSHSIIHRDACFAYFNKIWGIPHYKVSRGNRSYESKRGIGSVRKGGVRGAKAVVTALSGLSLSVAQIAVVFGALMTVPQRADAACSVTGTGTVNCNADTATTKTTDIDGSDPSSSARTQRFHNGSAISGTVQPGVTVGGFGLHLIEKPGAKNTEEPITLNNQGQVTTSNAVNALQLTGDGGSISYCRRRQRQ